MKLITMDYVDNLSGREFELFIKDLISYLDFPDSVVTNQSENYGLNVIATGQINNQIGIKCNHLKKGGQVGYPAIEEASSGCEFYKINKGVVITNQYLSQKAIIGALHVNIQLIDRDMLETLIKVVNNKLHKKTLHVTLR